MAQIVIKAILDSTSAKTGLSDLKQQISAIGKQPVKISVSKETTSKLQEQINALVGIGEKAKSASSSAQVFEKAWLNASDKISGAAKETSNNIDEISESTKGAEQSLVSMIGKFAQWYVIGNMVSGVRNAFAEALETMKAVDDQLVVVKKVTGATSAELAKMEQQAYKTASAYGVAADQYMESVAEFARAGYGDNSDALAELAVKTQLVGDITQATANQFLLSVDAGYQMKGSVEELTKVLDGANEIDNNYATSIGKIAEGLGIVAPVAAQAHVGIDELTAGIGTITAVTQRTGSEAARALRALFLNIVGDTKTEIDEGVTWTTGEISGLRDVIRMYASDAYEAAQATGEVINPMEAIAGLAQSMKDGLLTEQELMNMVSDIGGKLRTSQLLALIQNWDMYQSMLADYSDSVGSADREVENALDSWTRKTEILKNTWTEFISHLVSTDAIKTGLDVITAGVKLLDTELGHAAVTISALVAALAVLEKSYTKIKDTKILEFVGKGIEFVKTSTSSVDGLKNGVAALLGIIEAHPVIATITAAGVALVGLVKLVDTLTVTTEEHLEKADALKEEYDAIQNEIDTLNSDLSITQDRIAELQGKETLSVIEEEELNRLEASNRLLQERIRLLEEEAAIAQGKEANERDNAFEGERRTSTTTISRYNQVAAEVEQLRSLMDSNPNSDQFAQWAEDIQKAETELNVLQSQLENGTDLSLRDYVNQITEEYKALAAKEALTSEEEKRAQELRAEIVEESNKLQENYLDKPMSAENVAIVNQLIMQLGEAVSYADDFDESTEAGADNLDEAAASAKGLKAALSGIEDEAEPLKDAIEALENGSFDDISADAITELLKAFPDLRDEIEDYVDALESGEDPLEAQIRLQEQFQEALDHFNVEAIKSGIDDVVAAYEEFGAGSYEVEQALQNLVALSPALKAALYDAETGTWNLSDASLTSAGSLIAEAQAAVQAQIAAEQAKMDTLVTELGKVQSKADAAAGSLAVYAAYVMMAQSLEGAIGNSKAKIAELQGIASSLGNITVNIPSSGGGGSSRSGGSGSSKSENVYDTMKESLKETLEDMEHQIFLWEKQGNMSKAIIEQYRTMQDKVHALAEEYRQMGLDENSDYIQDLQKQWWDYEDEIEDVLKAMKDALDDTLDDMEHQIFLWEKNGGMSQAIISQYREMQEKLHELAEEYREMGLDENNDLIQELQKQWWEYEDDINDVVDSLKDELKDAIDDILDQAKKIKDAQIDAIDAQIDALKDAKEEEDKLLELEEKRLAVLEAEENLLSAQNERTVRVYNADTNQWDWVADARNVKSAEEALADAKKDLEDYEKELALEAEIEALEARKDAINAMYDMLEETWNLILDSMETPGRVITDILADLANTGVPALQSVVNSTTETLSGLTDYISSLTGSLSSSGGAGSSIGSLFGGLFGSSAQNQIARLNELSLASHTKTSTWDYRNDTTDYGEKMMSATTFDEFAYWAQERSRKMGAQNIDPEEMGYATNADLYEEWKKEHQGEKNVDEGNPFEPKVNEKGQWISKSEYDYSNKEYEDYLARRRAWSLNTSGLNVSNVSRHDLYMQWVDLGKPGGSFRAWLEDGLFNNGVEFGNNNTLLQEPEKKYWTNASEGNHHGFEWVSSEDIIQPRSGNSLGDGLGYIFQNGWAGNSIYNGLSNGNIANITNSGSTYYINGVRIGAYEAETMSIAQLARQMRILSLHTTE